MSEQTGKVNLPTVFYLFVKYFHIFFILFLVFTYLLAMPLGIYFFYFTADGVTYSRELINVGGFWFASGWLFGGLWLVICVCLFIAWTGTSEGIRRGLAKLKSFSIPWGNYILIFPLLTSLTYSLAFFLENILFLNLGVPVGPVLSWLPPHAKFLFITERSITEEIVFRLIPLGFPSLVLLLFNKRNRDSLRLVSWKKRIGILISSILEPTKAKNKFYKSVSFRNNLSKIEFFFVLISSIMFGLGHLGWGQGNAISALITSFVFGYAYYIYGIAGSILLHWFWNYYFTVYSYTSLYLPILEYLFEITFFFHIFAGFLLWGILLTKLLLSIIYTRF